LPVAPATGDAEHNASAQRGVAPATAGEGSPRLVIRGESTEEEKAVTSGESYGFVIGRGGRVRAVAYPLPKADGNPFAAITDYLNVTFPFEISPTAIYAFHGKLIAHLGPVLGGMVERNRGLYGYARSFAFHEGAALFACGGQRGTALLSLPGVACGLIADWPKATAFFRDVLNARITRWDGAVDDYGGQHSVDQAVAWYLTGGFNCGGNKPACRQAGNWIESDGKGRTFYVGSRENGKLLRVYEKGRQLGDAESPWVRWELELHNTDRVIPFDVLLEPGKYVAGAYRCTGWIQEEMARIRTIRKATSIGYHHLVAHAKRTSGRLINAMLQVEGSAECVIEKLLRPGLPARLDPLGMPTAGEPNESL
jgi:phage replication initiation protein